MQSDFFYYKIITPSNKILALEQDFQFPSEVIQNIQKEGYEIQDITCDEYLQVREGRHHNKLTHWRIKQ